MSSRENDDPRLLRRRFRPASPPGARARLAMASPPGYADDGFQFGEAARWLAFVAPYAAFASYVHAALSIKHGVLGFLEAFAVSLWTLPFWRAAHARPVFLPLTPLLARHHANCLLYTSPSPRDQRGSRMPSSA